MEIVSKKTSLNMNYMTSQKTKSFVVESDCIIPDAKPDILNTITTSGNVCIYKKELNGTRLKFDGSIFVYLMYLADDEKGKIRALQTSLDFTEALDLEEEAKENASSEMEVVIKNIECKVLNGRKVQIKAILEVDATIYQNENVEIIEELNEKANLQVMRKELMVSSKVGEGTTKILAKDTFVIDNTDDLAEILKLELKLVNQEYKISYHKVLLKADLMVKILYLTEERQIKSMENRIPVMGFVDMQDVKEEDFCEVHYEIENIILKPNPQEEHSIYLECELVADLKMYHETKINFLEDLYSTDYEMNFEKKEIKTIEKVAPIKQKLTMNEKVQIEELRGQKIYDMKIVPKINQIQKGIGKVTCTGEIEVELIYQLESGSSLPTKRMTLPFQEIMESKKIGEESNISVKIDVISDTCIMGENDQIELKLELELCCKISNITKVQLLDKIELSEKPREKHGMVIYLVREEDTLWQIAKNFCSSQEEIQRVNQLETINSLKVGQKLYIPSDTRKR